MTRFDSLSSPRNALGYVRGVQDLEQAAAFLAGLTGGDGWITPALFQTYDDRPEKRPWLSRALAGTLRSRGHELRQLNAAGACVAVAVKVLRGTVLPQMLARRSGTIVNGNAPLADVARFVAFLTAKPPNENVLARASVEEMRQPGKPMAENQWMGLSTYIIKRGEATILGHTGGQAFYRGYLYFNPATSAAVIYAFNTTSEASGEKLAGLRNGVFDFLAK